jgi:hypothetical protein
MSVTQAQVSEPTAHNWDGVFPLPLTPMEAFLHLDGRAGYPMMTDIQLEFDGALDPSTFERALATAINRNPLYRCLVGHDSRLGRVWIPTDEVPSIDWAPLGTPLGEQYDSTVDLTKQIGLRIWVRQTGNRTTVLLHSHHACADALGTFSFVEDLLAAYASLCPGAEPIALRPLEPERLLKRGLASIPKRKWYHHPFDLMFGVREGLSFFLRAPAPLASPNSATAELPASRSEMLTRSLGSEMTAGLRAAAATAGATVNDLLLCDLFVTLRRWNAARGQSKGWLRILMPQNLRESEDRATPTANIMSFAFLTRRANHCDAAATLLPALCTETKVIRRDRLSVFFLGSLAAALAAGVLEKLLASKICFSTAVLSNFGVPARRFVAQFPQTAEGLIIGNVVFRSLVGVPPLRPGTRAAFAVVGSADDLTFTVKCDPQYFGPIDAARLLDEYVGQVAATAAGARAIGSRR